MLARGVLGLCFVVLAFSAVKADKYDDQIVFTVYKPDNTSLVWQQGTNLTDQGFDKNGKFAFIVHGFLNSVSLWGKPMADKLNQYRGGCVIYVDWGAFSDNLNYGYIVLAEFQSIADAITRRLQHLIGEGVSTDNLFMVGHSLGARLVLLAGQALGGALPFIDALDPAGPGFFLDAVFADSKTAAKNVQCIHTSTNFGTMFYDCHQDWLMGSCGVLQCASKPIQFVASQVDFILKSMNIDISHNLANTFYINAFDNKFVANNCYNCVGTVSASSLPTGFRMGYVENRRNSSIIAKIASATGNISPFNGNDCCPLTPFF